jgi:hypothetical protein
VKRIIKKGKRKGSDYELLYSFMSLYLFVKFILGNEEPNRTNNIVIIDHISTLNVDEFKENWKEQPIVQRLGISTWEECKGMFELGYLNWEWV